MGNQNQPTTVQESKKEIRLVQKEIVSLSAFIIVLTAVLVLLFNDVFQKIEAFTFKQEVSWTNEHNYELATSPPWFWYHKEEANLIAIKKIEEADKDTLIGLYSADSTGFSSYKNAIDELAFKTNENKGQSYLWTLLLGGLAAMLGVQIRSIYRFIQRACYEQNIDAKTWWPWYLLRPVQGFLLGGVVILLADVDLISIQQGNDSLLFWIGLAALAGFGAPDVTNRLWMVSKTIFGSGEKN